MPKATANGKTFNFPDGTTPEQMGAAIDEFFAGQQSQPQQSESGLNLPDDPFEGLPEETIRDIESRFPLAGNQNIRSTFGAPMSINSVDPAQEESRAKAARLEQIRLVDPAMAAEIEETSDLDSFLINTGRGLTAIPRMLGAGFEEGDRVREQSKEFRGQRKTALAGQIVGESAPFAAVGGPLAAVGKTAIQKGIIGGALAGSEGYTISRAEGDDNKKALLSAAITAPFGVAGYMGNARASGAVRQNVAKESSKEVTKEIKQAAPSIQQLKDEARKVYDEIDDLGVSIKTDSIESLASTLRKNLEDAGLDKVNTPKAYRAIERLDDLAGTTPTLKQLDQIRETAGAAAGDALNKKESALGSKLISGIDDFLDNLNPNQFNGKSADLGGKYRQARDLWGRARRSELIEQAFKDAEDQASGVENGIRIAFRKILRNKKQRKLFKPHEIQEMEKVVRGTTSTNLAKTVGRLGISEGQAMNYLGGSVAAFGGASIFGPAGAVAVPAVGQVSKQLAQRLTKSNAVFADSVIRAGKDSRKIVTAYLKHTPKDKRNPEELAQLLMRPKVTLDNAPKLPISQEAVTIAQEMRQAANDSVKQAGSLAAGAAASQNE